MSRHIFHNRHFRGLVVGGLAMGAVMAAGTLGYHAIGAPKASWIDSFYMTFITVATIGYSEVVDLSGAPHGRLFTVAISVVGIATMSYLFSTFLALLIESDLNATLRRRRMERHISALSDHYIVCGIGRVGGNVAEELLATRRPFVVIEKSQEAIDAWLDRYPATLCLQGDAAEDEALLRAGLAQAAGVFAVTSDDSHNLMVSLSVKLLNPKARVVARLHDIRNADKARRAGADEVVSPDFTGGVRIASAMVRPHVVTFMDQMMRSEEGTRIEEVRVPEGRPVRPLGEALPRSPRYVLLALHEQGQWTFNPTETQPVRPGASLVLMTGAQGRLEVERLLAG